MGETSRARPIADRPPAALLPAWAARLAGFAGLVLLGALQWQRMVGGLSSFWALLWAAVAVLAAVGILWADTRARRPGLATVGVAIGSLLAAYTVSGLPLRLLKPARWGELVDGLSHGAEALGNAKLPYAAADPWPGLTLQLLGALLCMLAGLLAFWPRERDRGYPFFSLATLLVLVISPLVSLGGTRQIALGAVLAALTVCFLWLERLPLRPGLGVAALLGIALIGALPLASAADKDEPWFDYRSFAEGLGSQDPIRFSWNHSYGPITWPRDGSEVMRIETDRPSYWKLRELSEFDGGVWRDTGEEPGRSDAALDLPEDYRDRPGWSDNFKVSLRRLRGTDVVTSGTALAVTDASRNIRSAGEPGMYRSDTELQRGDSYTISSYYPRPTSDQLREASSGGRGRQGEDLVITVPFRSGKQPPRGIPRAPGGTPVRGARIRFAPFETNTAVLPRAEYPTVNRSGDGAAALRKSLYRRTWRLAKRLRGTASTPFEYIVAVDKYLHDGFSYDERPAPVPAGREPLDAFLIDTKSGYCQHFSGAMALLLRMGGVPARVVTGFSPGGFSKRKDAWVVRDTDAHSWVEVWFDSWGWVTFDPTPDATPARSQIAALEEAPDPGAAAADDGAADAAGGGGAANRRAGGVRADLLNDPLRHADVGGGGTGGGVPWGWLVVAGLALIALVAWVVAWVRAHRGGPRSRLDRLIVELESAIRRSGRTLPTGTTLTQLEARLGGTQEAREYLRALRAGRYAPNPALPTRDQRRAMRRELASGLGASGALRSYWALPPWR
jgi:transglutaminase-like putative cysteine protease